MRKCYAIYSLVPINNEEDEYRLVEIFDTKEDAEKVLKCLESVNISFNYYVLEEKELK